MDANEFGNYIMLIRDKVLSRPAMAEKSGLHANTIKGYEKEGRLADIDYLAALALETGHCFSDLVNKRLLAGKLGNAVEVHAVLLSDVGAEAQVNKKSSTVAIPVLGSNQTMQIDIEMLPGSVERDNLALFDLRKQPEPQQQILMFNTSDTVISDGQLYVLDIGNGAIARRMQIGMNGSLVLANINSGVAPLVIPREQTKDVVIIGKVVCVLSYS